MPNKADIMNLIPKLNVGDMLAGAFKDTATGTMPVQTQVAGTQAAANTTDMGCGGKKSKKRANSSNSSSDGMDGPICNNKVTCFKC